MNSQPLFQPPADAPDNSYAVLDAYDSLALARCSEIYLQALEHYILASSKLNKEHLLFLLRLYRTESAKGLNQTADILKTALGMRWQGEDDD